ncbi:MAG: YifB family Mg chelatase-like AAA ATPase [Leptospiraceae bacterium]|nr:YifB family Mg chelatase-like AAA ATPase [Leptospiraceae bacterium]
MENLVSITYTSEPEGIDSRIIRVEMSMKRGIPRFGIVGLAQGSTREATERVRIGLENSNFQFPLQNIIVNLSPAGFKKDTSSFDLAIAAGVLFLTGQLPDKLDITKVLFLGEIGLDGSVKPIKGLSNILLSPLSKSFQSIIIPLENKSESMIAENLLVYPISHISELIKIFSGETKGLIFTHIYSPLKNKPEGNIEIYQDQLIGLRSLVIALAGNHHILFMGSPGGGKTMLAELAKEFLPPLTKKEFEEVIKIKSISEFIHEETIQNIKRPFRSPHHTSSDISIVGGGKKSRIGEVTLSHNGVLFLDELGEFDPRVIQALREPLESGQVTISRVEYHLTYPASFLLIAASNPCPCGYKNNTQVNCNCSEAKIQKYISRLSGPFMDRMDLIVSIEPFQNSKRKKVLISKKELFENILSAREIQEKRYIEINSKLNGTLKVKNIEKVVKLNDDSIKLLETYNSNYLFSLRRIYKTIKISRTIADLEGSEEVTEKHLLEAIHYLPGIYKPHLKAA